MAEFIVAIELGSSVFRGIAGKKNPDGSITVQALVKEDATQCIRKGVVNNIDKTATCLKNIVAKLSKTMKQNISHVYVGVGGQSVRSVRNVIVKDLPTETIVDGDIVDGLMDSNRGMDYPDLEILNVVTQEYKVGNQYVVDPVGIKGTRLRVTSSTSPRENSSTATSTRLLTRRASPLPRSSPHRWCWPTTCSPSRRSAVAAYWWTWELTLRRCRSITRACCATWQSSPWAATTSPRISRH